uniref:Uncharacterized protein n=1 Tax=Arundo donax TaxID=35708 RepID=A0A0A9CB53_ARUDO
MGTCLWSGLEGSQNHQSLHLAVWFHH